jgi:tetratricopeptide (TPR) repeat protein
MIEKEQQQIELIEQYLDHQLSQKEKEEFEGQLEKDQKFEALYNEMKLIVAGVKNAARRELMENLKKTEQGLGIVISDNPFHIRKILVPLVVAASVVILISLSLLFSQNRAQNQLNAYLAEAMEPYQNIIHPTQRSDSNILSDAQLAFYYYDVGEYAKAIEIFLQPAMGKEDNQQSIRFYTGNAYMALENYMQAIEIFTILLGSETIFENQTRWYLSLCYLKVDERDKALEQLLILEESDSSYAARAIQLMSKL